VARIVREVDGERFEGVTRPVFIRNGEDYFLADLSIYADGSIFCSGWWVDLAGLQGKLASGAVATTFEPGARASVHELAGWRFGEARSWFTPEGLLGEVADWIDRLNGRPDSKDRCLIAVDQYLQSRSEQDRAALRTAYEAIPEHRRRYALADMDRKDWPLRVLCAGVGGRIETHFEPGGTLVTDEMHQDSLEYFAKRQHYRDNPHRRTYPDGPEGADSATVHLNGSFPSGGWPADAGVLVLRNEYPAAVEIDSVSYPTVEHGYWALAVADPAVAEQIRAAEWAYEAEKLARQAGIRADWPAVRLAVMTGLLRAKFAQHPALADVLLATGDGRVEYTSSGSGYWSAQAHDGQGRNWIGRLLELIRSEIAAQRIADPSLPTP
jgi:predicted NAD-dependent protein-ADP-ribosyltransferase YbiA (DUF1768 family)